MGHMLVVGTSRAMSLTLYRHYRRHKHDQFGRVRRPWANNKDTQVFFFVDISVEPSRRNQTLAYYSDADIIIIV